ncbi:MAG: 30S ribosomal protein S16 [Proteobacteria bacterium]|nr:30S ribosomal protein S16 [Pseudomonadota bacterium]
MSLRIRLSRGGAKKRPFYRIVVADSRNARDGRYIERLGTYNPMVAKDHPDRLTTVDERIKYWLGVGAKPSERVIRFLSDVGLVEKPTFPEQTKQHMPRPKTLERQKDAEEKAKAAAEAPPEAPAEEAPAEAAPVEAAPVEAAPVEAAPVEAAKADEAPAEAAPVEAAKADEAPAEAAPAEAAKANEAPAEAAGGEDKGEDDKKDG